MTPIETEPPEEFLATPLLSGADEKARSVIFRHLAETSAPAGTALMVQGRPNDKLWFVVRGSVAVERKQPDGRVDVVANFSGPALYGTTTFFRSTGPSSTIRATSDLIVWTLDHRSHAQLRREHPREAEILALEVVRALSERFDQLDARLAGMIAGQPDGRPRANEWASFRSRLFEETSI